MPNWCDCMVEARVPNGTEAEAAQLQEMLTRFASLEGCFNFSAYHPIPEPLKDVHTGSIQIDGVAYTQWRVIEGDGEHKNIPLSDEEATELKQKYGSLDWYQWCVNNWGTKWDANKSHDDETFEIMAPGVARVAFLTAWNPPEEAIKELSRQYPLLEFVLHYVGDGYQFAGLSRYREGRKIEEQFEEEDLFYAREFSAWHDGVLYEFEAPEFTPDDEDESEEEE